MNCKMICKCCGKEFMVTDIDFVNSKITIIIDDLRCNLDTIDFSKIKELYFNDIKVYIAT